MAEGAEPERLVELVGVYDADGTLSGELRYWVGARLGRAHCSLCDITHGTFRERDEWVRGRTELPVPFATYHRDDQPAEVRRHSGGVAPVVVARTDARWVTVLGPAELDECAGSVDRFRVALDAALEHLGLGEAG